MKLPGYARLGVQIECGNGICRHDLPSIGAVGARAGWTLARLVGPLKFGDDAPGRGGLSSGGRKHLTAKQKAFAGARMARLQDGGDRRSKDFSSPNGELKALTLPRVSEITGASERQISRATQILKHEEIREKVEGGKVRARGWVLPGRRCRRARGATPKQSVGSGTLLVGPPGASANC